VNGNYHEKIIQKSRFKRWMDQIFLKVIAESELSGNQIFEALFKNNSPVLILKFLEEETHW
jgi:hypothetical protein